MPKLKIDDQEIEVPAGMSILQACEQVGVEIPRFCYHDKLSVPGNCRMCLVEVEKMPKPVASCVQPCADGMVVHTGSAMVHKAREGVMEMLLINHPLDCPICDQGGECDLQDQAMGYGRDRSRYTEYKRAVPELELGPLVKTEMTRCIHCTRCVRFMDEIAGTPELGGIFRGEKLQIHNVTGKPLSSELSGNIIDICPVGALTNKPAAFTARSWELKGVEGIDVMDGTGSNIRIDIRGNEVMRILPRLNEDVNEEWIHDKTRFAFDGLKYQRLDVPYIRKNGKLAPASWDEALGAIAARMKDLSPSKLGAIAGDLADCESMFALKLLMQSFGSTNMDCRQDGADYDVSARAGYIMNSTIAGIEEADAILLIGTNPRHEAPLINARIRKGWLAGGMRVGMIGMPVNLGYPYEQVGNSPNDIENLLDKKNWFGNILRAAKKPMVILGAGALARADGAAIQMAVRELAETMNMIRQDWNGFNILQNVASRVGGLDIGFVPSGNGLATHGIIQAATAGKIEVVYLLGADEVDMKKLGNAFVIYQGHHGDAGAHRADVILPGCAYTEKPGLYVNTEGRAQMAIQATTPPGEARADWKIIRALSDAVKHPLPFDDLGSLRAMMAKTIPTFAHVGQVTKAEWQDFGKSGDLLARKFEPAIDNFYMTNPITRSSPTMAKCVQDILREVAE